MRVGDYMTKDPITVEEDASMKDAMLLLRMHHIRHLPVAMGRLLVGLVSDRDIKRAAPSILSGIDKAEFEQLMEDTPVSRIMTREPFTVSENASVLLSPSTTSAMRTTWGLAVVEPTKMNGAPPNRFGCPVLVVPNVAMRPSVVFP